MKVSLAIIRDFVDIPTTLMAQEFAKKVTLTTAEVEGVELIGDHWQKIKIVKVISLRKHPDADNLRLVTFETGQGLKEVVCGASNVREGLITAYAPVGVTLPTGLTLEPKKIRGFLSEGMLCSDEELGLATTSEGIKELPANAPIGLDLGSFFKQTSDVVLDIDNKSLTHRPDLWGHYGFAREVATMFQLPLKPAIKNQKIDLHHSSQPSPIIPVVDPASSCLSYLALSMDGVQIAESPEWMQQRLKAVGLRPINNIVDISNYVMIELGIPLHIFDRESIKDGKIFVRPCHEASVFVTLDEMPRQLHPRDTVICDATEPLVLAGIMGGLNSGVTSQTKNIFIEVANWQATEVRRTSVRLGLRTDSSQRYEKSLDSFLCEQTMQRTVQLILELCPAAKIVGKLETYHRRSLAEMSAQLPKIKTSTLHIQKSLGTILDENQVIKTFTSLGFGVEKNADHLIIAVPSFRATKDVSCEADLVEEIGRVIGYDNIAPVSPQWSIKPARFSNTQKYHRKIRDFLVQHGEAFEVMTYPLIGADLLKRALWPEENLGLKLLNALSDEQNRMRPSLIPSVLEAVALNQKYFSSFHCFEIGRSYQLTEGDDFAKETSQVLVAFYDRKSNPFSLLLNRFEDLLRTCSIAFDWVPRQEKFKNPLVPLEWPGTHPHEYLELRSMGGLKGALFSVHPLILKNYKIKGHLSLALLDLSAFESRAIVNKFKYRPLQKFQDALFDCTVVAATKTYSEDLLKALKPIKLKELVESKIVTVFPLSEEQKAVTVRVRFMDAEKTLSGEFLKQAEDLVVKTLNDAGFPLKQ
jgi:phenylalanyl-tRNA synthetase beta chain